MRYTRGHAFHFVILACTLLISSGCSSADATPSSRPGPSGPLVLPPATTSSTSAPHPTSGFATSPATALRTTALPSPVLPTVFSSLYALDKDAAIWRLDASSRTFKRVSPEGVYVRSFAISPSDGAIAYGDYTGAISIVQPGRKPRILLPPELESSGAPLLPIAMQFSNSGDSLAFALHSEGGLEGVPDELLEDVTSRTGLWIMNMSDMSRYQLVANQYPTPDNAVSYGHIYTDPTWAPDDQAISLVVAHWEGWDMAWVFPLGSQSPAAIHDPIQQDWAGSAWAPDSSGLYLSGKPYDDVSNLDFADRTGQSITTYFDGTLRKGYVSSALPIGNSVLFAASIPPDHVPLLYLGELIGGEFVYSPLPTIGLPCYPLRLTAAPDDATILVSCSDSAIAFSTDTGAQTDLTTLLQRDINPDISRITFKWAPQP